MSSWVKLVPSHQFTLFYIVCSVNATSLQLLPEYNTGVVALKHLIKTIRLSSSVITSHLNQVCWSS